MLIIFFIVKCNSKLGLLCGGTNAVISLRKMRQGKYYHEDGKTAFDISEAFHEGTLLNIYS